MRNFVKPFLYVSGIIFLSSCAYKKIENEAPELNIIEVHKKYRVNLPEEHSSGYTWQLSADYDKSLIENTSAVWHGNTKGVDFNFNTLSAGTTTLNFILRKYNDTSNVKHFVVKIQGD